MAGIGFELRRVVSKGGVSAFMQTAMSGAMIVAGPWLLSILTISIIQKLIDFSGNGSLELFMGAVIYCYAFSLFIFGGVHYLFTRRMSDLIYEKKERQALGYVLLLMLPVAGVSAVIALPAVLNIDTGIEHLLLFKASAAVLFITVNCLWLIMLFVSVLKWYIKILVVYTAGLASSLFLIKLLSQSYGTAGALAGFTAGHIVIVLLLALLSAAAYSPLKPELEKKSGFIYKYRYLLGAGVFYYWGIWADKLIFWFTKGTTVEGTFFKMFAEYDIPVYLANLTMIPGLIFFVIYSETDFYIALKHFLHRLINSHYPDINRAKLKLKETTVKSLKEQSLLQAVTAGFFIIITDDPVMQITLAAVFSHLLLLTLLNYLYYIEQYRHAFYSSLLFFTANAVTAVIQVLVTAIPPGTAYFISASAASLFAMKLLFYDLKIADRYILTKT